MTTARVTAPDAASLPRPHFCALGTLTTTLRATRNHGDLSRLAASMARDGLRHPVTVSAGGQVITGLRRVLAAILADASGIEVYTVTTIAEALAVIRAEQADDITDPRLAALVEPPTIAALAEYDDALRSLERWHRGTGGGHRLALAAAGGNPDGTPFWNQSQYSSGRAIRLSAKGLRGNADGLPAARSLLEEKPPLTSRDVTVLLSAVRGSSGAVARAGLPGEDVTPDQRAELDEAVTELIRYLTRLRKGLR